MEWFERWFGEEYLLVYEHRDGDEAERDVMAIERLLGLRPGEIVLDLCCGSGRHDLPLAARGLRVVGLDYSSELLSIAHKARLSGERYPVYVRADARDTVFRDGTFDAVLNLFTSFGYFTDGGNEQLLRSVCRMLKPAGRFYIDYLNPPCVLANLVERSEKNINGIGVIEIRRYVEEKRRVEKDITLTRNGESMEFHESVRLYGPGEMSDMLVGAGLTVQGFLGSTDCDEYGADSERMIVYGRKD
ncbi:MAG: methyltransferase domain-containing protein [Candidatus Latescibacteria bacterium]|nr:methyltransferase domain-containing protein [Candidatus Latescibacterota bacterium]